MTAAATPPAIDAVGGWRTVLGELTEGHDLPGASAAAALASILAGEATDAQIAAFIVALRLKGETVEEVAGMVGAMLDAAAPLELPEGTIDVVGTGGSPRRRIKALNVSTMACVVAAAAGATVCKHGNLKASSTSGSFDLLGALGVGYDLDGAALGAVVREVGLGFCFARAYHPAMRHAGPVRAELGVPTVFNLLGPLSHPGRVRRQVVGVGDARSLDLVAGALAARGSRHALVVHGDGSLDELALTGPTEVREVRDGEVVGAWQVVPGDVGLDAVEAEQLPGGDAGANAEIARRVLGGDAGPARDIVLLNAGAALLVAGVAPSLPDGVAQAAAAVDDGRAAAKLEQVRLATQA
ncbi:MAG TPA: anthranilate phosphoribosyltransferase [Acidimicrobiales bacterium]|nr:anthranilate phosphoribosyltransferase [Acidimicrobiales bacterium]